MLNAQLAWNAVAGRRLARISLLVRVVGVAFATLVLLLAASANGALESRGDRITWRTTWDPAAAALTPDEAWLQVAWENDYYLGHEINRVRIEQLSEQAEAPPGLPRIPLAGESFVSPALARLIEADPEVLGNRYSDTIAGTIGDGGLSDPGELLVITGVDTPDGLGFGQLYRELPSGFENSGITLFMWVVVTIGVVVLLFPIAMFIASAARLNAQESDARLAAFRLAGADPGRVRWIVACEALIAAVPGALLGFVLFFATRPIVAQVELDGASFFASDFALNRISWLVLVVVPAVVVAASFVGLRDVDISPLGVSRRGTRKAVRPIGFVLLVPGFVLLWYILGLQGNDGIEQVGGLVVSILLILAGVALVGTWLGQCVARLCAARVRSGSALLAFRRIVADPHGSFRTVSGVTFAVFAGTLFLSLAAALEREVEIGDFSGLRSDIIWVSSSGQGEQPVTGLPEGTSEVTLVEAAGLIGTRDEGRYLRIFQGDCDVIARVLPITGGCEGRISVRAGLGVAPGEVIDLGAFQEALGPDATVTIPSDAHAFELEGRSAWPDIILPPGTIPALDAEAGATVAFAPPPGVGPGDRAFEQIRTAAMRAYPWSTIVSAGEYDAEAVDGIGTMRNLVYAGTFAAFLLSGGTAAMAVAGSILARRQSFALLRMSGCTLGALRRTIMAEATLPLVLVSVVSAGMAVAVSALMIWRIGEGSILPPPAFALPLVAGLLLGLALPLMTLPMLGAVTRVEQTRFD